MDSLFLLLSSESTRAQTRQVAKEVNRATDRAAKANDDIVLLKADIEKLMMISEALWKILKEQHGYSDIELERRIEAIDLQDGKLDGKVARTPPEKCPSCERTILGKRSVCLWCGQRVDYDPFER